MSTPAKAAGRKTGSAAAHTNGSRTYSEGDALLRDAIYRAVRGEPSPWPIDSEFPKNGTFEDRYRNGDQQILLWAIDDCAQRRQPLPEWVTQELNAIVMRLAKGEFSSWENAFGRLRAKGWQRRRILGLTRMYDVWARVRQKVGDQKSKKENIEYDLIFEDVSHELKKAGYRIGIARVKKYYGLVQRDIKLGLLNEPPVSKERSASTRKNRGRN